ncbi:MAG: hypothetical protein D6730_22810 [Bacteroidetes bacterium]|nr:MAG: hypothetical protein D6730_22810 [Bacteroidota bacterium]
MRYISSVKHDLFGLHLCMGLLCLPLMLLGQQPQLQLSFIRQNNFTYSTRMGLKYQWQREKYQMEVRLNLDNIYNAGETGRSFVQFYLQTHIWQYRQLTPAWEAVSWLESDQFFNASSHRLSLYAGLRYKWKDYLSITPLLGYSLDYRSMIPDNGLSPALLVTARYAWPDGLQMETRGFARIKYINPRRQQNMHLSSIWSRNFGSFASLNLGLEAGNNQLDNYTLSKREQILADTFAVEQIISDTLAPFVSLRYQLLPQLEWESDNRLIFSRRQLDYLLSHIENDRLNDRSFDQLQVHTRQKLSFAHQKLSAYFLYEYQYLGRRYELENTTGQPSRLFQTARRREQQKDYFRNLNEFELALTYQLRPRHRLQLSAHNRYLRYDTPAEDNFDDHDQLNYGFAAEWQAAWSSKFTTQYKLLGSLRQYAFLLKERSQDNYTQRSLRLEFTYRWLPLPRLTLSGEQYIYVTYNVKDFEDRNRTDRSTRNLETTLEASYRAHAKLDMELTAYRKEIHVAYLNWQQFAETPLDTTRTYIIEQTNKWQIKSWKQHILFLDLGYKHFSQTRRFNTSMMSLQNILTPINLRKRNLQTGFQTGIRWVQRHPASMSLAIWWQFQYQDFHFQQISRFSSLSGNLTEAALREKTLNFRPFVQLRMNVFLQR